MKLCYLKLGCSDESLIIGVTRAAAPEWDREENFSTRLNKIIKSIASMVHSGSKQCDVLAEKLTSVLKMFEKQFPVMECKIGSLNLGRKERGHTERFK